MEGVIFRRESIKRLTPRGGAKFAERASSKVSQSEPFRRNDGTVER